MPTLRLDHQPQAHGSVEGVVGVRGAAPARAREAAAGLSPPGIAALAGVPGYPVQRRAGVSSRCRPARLLPCDRRDAAGAGLEPAELRAAARGLGRGAEY